NLIWTRQFGTTAGDQTFSIAVDSTANIYAAGTTTGNLQGTNAGDRDAFVVKYDSAGNFLWSRQIGSVEDEAVVSTAVDSHGNVYLSGETGGDLAGTNAGPWDHFLAKYDSLG